MSLGFWRSYEIHFSEFFFASSKIKSSLKKKKKTSLNILAENRSGLIVQLYISQVALALEKGLNLMAWLDNTEFGAI